MSRIPKAQQPGHRFKWSNPQACFDSQKKPPALSLNVIKLARKSGELNLTGVGLADVPDQLWNINNLTEDERRELSISLDECDGDRWWDQADFDEALNDNALTSLPDTIGNLHHLTKLNIRQALHFAFCVVCLYRNKLQRLPDSFYQLKELRQLLAHHNEMAELGDDVGNLSLLELVDLSHNKLSSLPAMIGFLSRAANAWSGSTLSNNNLASLPYELGTLAHLKGLGVEGNPLRAIRRDIVKRGTVHLLKWLQDRLGESPEGAARKRLSGGACLNDGSDLIESIEKFALKTTHALELSKRSLHDVPEEIFKMAAECDANTIDLSKNALESVPKGLEAACPVMTELNLSFNKLAALPGFLCLATKLTFLDLRNNQLNDLPGEMSMLSHVREVNLSFNRFSRIPKVVMSWESLEILFAADNKIEELDMAQLQKLKQLAVLDLRNNNIRQVPPELGNMRQLRSLQLEGNPFRNPRPAILSKGTPALLEFLRDRIPR
ncbi:hypothetical protein HPB51_003153 [Rhipicephalus microplus]|uniref:Uncharacterized protein n=1 Tax=Rhipicephalus microplus TaxID=6941 RepID=A0A9J6EKJ5_RHIMP|nr:hypothetical protein HPB51_003153 [Rhipicephalus microplus]